MGTAHDHWRIGHRPGLDALRGLAVLLVVASHVLRAQYTIAGTVGVAMFFVLSGFLITTLLLEESDDTGTLSLRRFYERRVRRLAPAAVVCVAVVALLGVKFGPHMAASSDLLPALLYVQNFAVIAGRPVGALPHLWSLAVEEQFYLLWPLVLLLVRRRSVLIVVTATLAALSFAARAWLLAGDASTARIYYGSDTNACLLLAGCLLAIGMHRRPLPRPRPLVLVIALVCVLLLGLTPRSINAFTVMPLLAAALTVIAIPYLMVVARAPAWLMLVGRRSYALYLWHYPLIAVMPQFMPLPTWVATTLMVAASWIAASLSWHLVERRFLRRPADPRGTVPDQSRHDSAAVRSEA